MTTLKHRDTAVVFSQKPEGIFDDTRGYKKRAAEPDGETQEEKFARLANAFSVSRCVYCASKNIVKRGMLETIIKRYVINRVKLFRLAAAWQRSARPQTTPASSPPR